MFNAYVDTSEEDPNEAWKWRGTRSNARNKAIAIHAQLTSNYLLPLFSAQNEDDELDKDFSEIMRDIIEWMALPTNSNYQPSFLQLVFGMMYNPVTYAECDWYDVKQKLSKAYDSEEIRDDVLSGFKLNVFGPTQILINNQYERNIQKQKNIIKRKYIEFSEAEALFGWHENFQFVKAGRRTIYDDDDGLFYDTKDESHPTLVPIETYLNRREDLEVTFLGGIYMGDKDVENNPIRHRDNKNRPKYNIVPFGYSRIGDNYFYFKSMMNVLQWDNLRIDAMDEIVYNRGLLDVDMPLAISGSEKVESDVIFPKSVVTFENKDTKVQPLLPPANLIGGFRQLEESQRSSNDSSVDEVTAGQRPDASEKVGNVARAQANARKILGAVGKNMAESVVQIGDLMKDIAIRHITIPEVQELVGGQMKLRYQNIILEGRTVEGKAMDKKIVFDESLIGRQMNAKQRSEKGIAELEKMAKKKGIKDLNKIKDNIAFVNPQLFANFKFLTRVDVEEMFSKNAEFMQPMLTNLYTLLREDPFVDGEGLVRKLLYSFFNSDGEELVKEDPETDALQNQAGIKPPGPPNTVLGQQANNTATADAVKQAV